MYARISAFVGVEHLTTTACHLHTSGKAKNFNVARLVHLQHNDSEYLKNWHTIEQPLRYAYKTRIYCSTNLVLFNLDLRRHPSRPLLLHSDTFSEDTHRESSCLLLLVYLEVRISTLCTKLIRSMKTEKAIERRLRKPHMQGFDLQTRGMEFSFSSVTSDVSAINTHRLQDSPRISDFIAALH